MAEEGSRPLQREKHEKYCLGVLSGLPKMDAYMAAGYNTVHRSGWYQLEKRPEIQARIQWLRCKGAEKRIQVHRVNRESVTGELQEVIRQAMAGNVVLGKDGEPVMVKNEDGDYVELRKPDLPTATRTIEVKAKVHGLMVDVQRKEDLDSELDGKSPDQLKAFVLGLLETLDPNMRKSLVADLESQAADEATPVDGTVLQ